MGIPAPNGVNASGQPNKGDQANAVISGKFTAAGPGDAFSFRGPMNVEIYGTTNTSLTTTAGSLAATVGAAGTIAAGDAINSVNVPPGTTVGAIVAANVTLAVPPVSLPASNFSTLSQNVTLPPGSNVATLLGATVTVPSNNEQLTLSAGVTVIAIIQTDVAATSDPYSPGVPGIIQLSAAPTVVPNDPNPRYLRFAPIGNAIQKTGADANALFIGAGGVWSGTVQLERSFDGGSTFIVCNQGNGIGAGTAAKWTSGNVSFSFGEPEKNVLYRLNCAVFTSGVINWRISQTGGAAESLAIGPLTGG